jgi:hypothetical protein
MKLTLCVLLVSLLPVAPAAAKHWHEDRKHSTKHSKAHDRDDDEREFARHGVSCYFGPRDVRIIREYYEPRYRNLPPGLAKKFYRSGRLPPGWAKKIEPLPVAVERQLVVLPPTYMRGYIDGVIVVYAPRTQVMIDVVRLVSP